MNSNLLMILQGNITIRRNYKPVYFLKALKYAAYIDIKSWLTLNKIEKQGNIILIG